MAIEIRLLQPDEAKLLTHVAEDLFDDPLVPHATQEFLHDARHHLAIAREEELVIGFASGVHYVHPDKPHPEFWINEVGVAPTHHGRGIGKALMRVLLEHARHLGCSEAWVLTERDNIPAMRLYAATGGVEAEPETVMFNFDLKRAARE